MADLLRADLPGIDILTPAERVGESDDLRPPRPAHRGALLGRRPRLAAGSAHRDPRPHRVVRLRCPAGRRVRDPLPRPRRPPQRDRPLREPRRRRQRLRASRRHPPGAQHRRPHRDLAARLRRRHVDLALERASRVPPAGPLDRPSGRTPEPPESSLARRLVDARRSRDGDSCGGRSVTPETIAPAIDNVSGSQRVSVTMAASTVVGARAGPRRSGVDAAGSAGGGCSFVRCSSQSESVLISA